MSFEETPTNDVLTHYLTSRCIVMSEGTFLLRCASSDPGVKMRIPARTN